MEAELESPRSFIPSGNCVDDELENLASKAETFNEIDAGNGHPSLLGIAKLACETCVQIDACEKSERLIVEELWKRGAGAPVVRGKRFEISVADSRDDTVIEDMAIPFDLTVLPKERKRALAAIRQGVRCGQLVNLGKNQPDAVVAAATDFLGRLEQADPQLYSELTTSLGDEARVCVGTFITLFMQQKDFKAFQERRGDDWKNNQSTEKRRRAREQTYDPTNIKPDLDDPIIADHVRDVLAIKEIGFSECTKCAIRQSPNYYRKVMDKGLAAGLLPWEVNRFAQEHRENLDARFDERLIELEDLRLTRPEITEYARRRILSRRPTDDTARPQRGIVQDSDNSVTKLALGSLELGDSVVGQNKRQRRRSGTTFTKVLGMLKHAYAADPDFDEESYQILAESRTESTVLEIAAQRKEALDLIRGDSDGSVPDRALCRLALREGIGTFTEAKQIYLTRKIQDRLYKRSEDNGSLKVDAAVIKRIVALYPETKIDVIADNVYKFYNSGLLVTGHIPTQLLQDDTWQDDLDNIFDSRTRQYCTFSTAFAELSPAQRLDFANRNYLIPLLYGREVPQLLLNEITESTVWSEELGEKKYNKPTALPAARLCQDILWLDETLKQQELPTASEDVTDVYGVWYARIVVAGNISEVGDRSVGRAWEAFQAPQRAWLQARIASAYPPDQQEVAMERVQNSLAEGVLMLHMVNSREYRITFSDSVYKNITRDIDFAVLANGLGLDRLLYNTDLSRILATRADDRQCAIVFHRDKNFDIENITDTILPVEQDEPVDALTEMRQLRLRRSLLKAIGTRTILSQIPENELTDVMQNLYTLYLEKSTDTQLSEDEQLAVSLAWKVLYGNDLSAMTEYHGVSPRAVPAYSKRGIAIIGNTIKENLFVLSAATSELLRSGQVSRKRTENVEEGKETEISSSGFDYFMRKARRIPLLKPEQEVELGQAVQAGIIANDHLTSGESLTDEERVNLQLMVYKGLEAKNTIVAANIRLILPIAKRYLGYGMDLEDLVDEGTFGLIRAAEKFNPNLGYKFSTYATNWIRQAIGRAMGDKSRAIRLPHDRYNAVLRVKRTENKIFEETGEKPGIAQLASALGMDESDVRQLMIDGRNVSSLDEVLYGGGDRPGHDTDRYAIIADNNPSPENRALTREANQEAVSIIQQALRNIVNNTKLVRGDKARERFAAAAIAFNGLSNIDPRSIVSTTPYEIEPGKLYKISELASILGVSDHRAAQLKSKIGELLRNELAPKSATT